MTDTTNRPEEAREVLPATYGLVPLSPRTNGIGTAAGVLGIVGTVLIWVPFLGGILTLLALILGAVGVSRAGRQGSPKGMAITGIVLGAMGVALYIVVTVVLAVSVGMSETDSISGDSTITSQRSSATSTSAVSRACPDAGAQEDCVTGSLAQLVVDAGRFPDGELQQAVIWTVYSAETCSDLDEMWVNQDQLTNESIARAARLAIYEMLPVLGCE